MGCQAGVRCQKTFCLRGRPLKISVCPKKERILVMWVHIFGENKLINKNDAKLQGSWFCTGSAILCWQLWLILNKDGSQDSWKDPSGHLYQHSALTALLQSRDMQCRSNLPFYRGRCWGQHLILLSSPLPCLRSSTRLVMGSSWQSLVLPSYVLDLVAAAIFTAKLISC